MKSAWLLAKDVGFYDVFCTYLKQLDFGYLGGEQNFTGGPKSITVAPNESVYFTLYDRSRGSEYFETYDVPVELRDRGYAYAYLVECRSEERFCQIVGATPNEIDVLVLDSDGRVFRPNELAPETLSL